MSHDVHRVTGNLKHRVDAMEGRILNASGALLNAWIESLSDSDIDLLAHLAEMVKEDVPGRIIDDLTSYDFTPGQIARLEELNVAYVRFLVKGVQRETK